MHSLSNKIRKSDYLDFVLPPFTRFSWVSSEAQSVWQPRFLAVTNAWAKIEWVSVIKGLRKCSMLTTRKSTARQLQHDLTNMGLAYKILSEENECAIPGDFNYFDDDPPDVIVAGQREHVEEFMVSLQKDDYFTVVDMLGYPLCCAAFNREVAIDTHSLDYTWSFAANCIADCTTREFSSEINLKCSPYTNILWHPVGIRSTPHVPCSDHCERSFNFALDLINLGLEIGLKDEMMWLVDILSWPVEWSCLHGIAEVKSPVVKIISRTDATSIKYNILYYGESTPDEGSVGLNFPFVKLEKERLTASKAYLSGLGNQI
jgi:hypothetical protein